MINNLLGKLNQIYIDINDLKNKTKNVLYNEIKIDENTKLFIDKQDFLKFNLPKNNLLIDNKITIKDLIINGNLLLDKCDKLEINNGNDNENEQIGIGYGGIDKNNFILKREKYSKNDKSGELILEKIKNDESELYDRILKISSNGNIVIKRNLSIGMDDEENSVTNLYIKGNDGLTDIIIENEYIKAYMDVINKDFFIKSENKNIEKNTTDGINIGNRIILSTNGDNNLVISKHGYVGINTDFPTSNLYINGKTYSDEIEVEKIIVNNGITIDNINFKNSSLFAKHENDENNYETLLSNSVIENMEDISNKKHSYIKLNNSDKNNNNNIIYNVDNAKHIFTEYNNNTLVIIKNKYINNKKTACLGINLDDDSNGNDIKSNFHVKFESGYSCVFQNVSNNADVINKIGTEFNYIMGPLYEDTNEDDNLYFYQIYNGNRIKYKISGERVSTFTGCHLVKPVGNIGKLNIKNKKLYDKYVGKIVISHDSFYDYDNNGNLLLDKYAIKINSSLPEVELSTQYKDKRVYGVITDRDNDGKIYTLPDIYKNNIYDRIIVNALGDGGIWVCDHDSNNISIGDYITSSPLPGYGCKQTEPYLCNYTVAKSLSNVDWNNWDNVKKKYRTHESFYNGVKYLCVFIGVTYHCS